MIERPRWKYFLTSADVDWRSLRAARANRVFRAEVKRVRAENTVMEKSDVSLGGSYIRSSIACGYAFYPHAIDDPRGRGAVRASAGDFFSTQVPNFATRGGAT